MEIDYAAAMARRARGATRDIEANRRRSAKHSGETFVPASRDHAASPGARPTARPVLMAVATKGGGVISQHFGHAREFLIYEASAAGRALHRPPQDRSLLRRRRHLRRWRERCWPKTIRALAGCEVVLCSKIGYEPWGQLEAAGIQPNGEHAMEPIEEAVRGGLAARCSAAGKLRARQADRESA